MSVNEDHQIAALREAGHDKAADHLVELAQAREKLERQQEAHQAAKAQLRPGIPLVSDAPDELRRQMEGHAVREALRASGVGQSWASAGSLLGEDRRQR